jgi:arylformamidase
MAAIGVRSIPPCSATWRGLNAHGVTVAVAGYDLCPIVAIADIIEQMRRACLFLWQRLGRRPFVYGHSAGGHLAAAMVGTDWPALYPKAPADLVPSGYAISGVFDLTPLVGLSQNQDLRLTAADARNVSPAFWPAIAGHALDAVAGGLESSEFKRQSRIMAEAWRGAARTRYEEIAGTNHFTIIDALPDAKSAMVARIAELAQQIKA